MKTGMEINEDVKSLLEAHKKMKICETIRGGHTSTPGDGVCAHCGALLDVNNYHIKTDRMLEGLFSRGIGRMPVERLINNMRSREYGRDFRLSKYIAGGKYLIDTVLPKLKSDESIDNVIATAYLLGYYDQKHVERLARIVDRNNTIFSKALLTRYTINNARDIKSFMLRKYDKEQIDELLYFNEDKPINTGFSCYELPFISDPEYFSKKMTELHEQKKFKKLKILGSMFIKGNIFREVDSRFIPFAPGETIRKLEGDPILAEYKQEIIDNYKYINVNNADGSDGKVVVILAGIQGTPKKEDRMIKMPQKDNPCIREHYDQDKGKEHEKPSLRFIR